jgi:hypothetical protein
MRTESLVNAGSLVTSGSSTTDGGEQHRYPRYDALDAFPAISPAKDTSARSIRCGAAIFVACLIEAILILGFVVASLGLGYEGRSSVGPDRPPPPPLRPAPAPPPDQLRIAP